MIDLLIFFLEHKEKCTGLYMFSGKPCRLLTDFNATLCDGRVVAQHLVIMDALGGKKIDVVFPTFKEFLKHKKGIFILGLGELTHAQRKTRSIQTPPRL